MSRLRRPPPWSVISLMLTLCVGWGGCSHPATNRGPDASGHELPFRASETTAREPNSETSPASLNEAKDAASGIPFHDSQSLPAGTLLIVLLKTEVSSDNSASSTFMAVVDEPIVAGGATLVPRGALAVGRVESAGSSAGKPNRSYLRLTLDSVQIGSQDLTLHTSSLFARGDAVAVRNPNAAALVRLEQGRRLTFRLTEPAYVVSQPAISRR